MSGTAPDVRSSLLVARGITRSFGSAPGLRGVDLEVREREIHGLLGTNGAGKSTLCRIVAGHSTYDEGEITYRGYPIRLRSIRDALRIGIAIVTENPTLAPDLSVLENIFLPELGRPGRLDMADLRRRGLDLLATVGRADRLPLDREVGRLTASERQVVEICKALAVRAKLVLFDEPTATLEARERGQLFDLMTRLRLGGRGVMFASQRPEEILGVADRVTVMRDGRTVLDAIPVDALTLAEARSAMRGESARFVPPKPDRAASRPVVLDVRGVAALPAVQDVTLAVRSGEIVGVAGLVGAGRSETLEAIFGLRRRQSGVVQVGGHVVPAGRPRAAIAAGLSFAGEDRCRHNILPDLSVADNLRLAGRGPGVQASDAGKVLAVLDLTAPGLFDTPMRTLSADQQQRVVIARCLSQNVKAAILDEPTKGVDLTTRDAIHAALRDAAAGGTAILVVSSDPEDLLDVSDRIVVMSDGRTVADVASAWLDTATLELLATPRAMLARNTALLADLTAENGGASFWVRIDGDRIVCLNVVVREPDADPGFKTGEAVDVSATRIPAALRRCAPDFVEEAADDRFTMLVPLRGGRGADLGFIGLSLTGREPLPPPAAVKFRIETLAVQL